MTNDDKTHWLQLYKKECRNYFNYRSKRDKCELEYYFSCVSRNYMADTDPGKE